MACGCSRERRAASRRRKQASGLLQTVGPHFDGIEAGLAALSELRDKPVGSLRITSVEHASQTILAPALAKLLPDYPDIIGRNHQRLWADRHCRRSLRCGHSPWRAGCAGHDRRAHRCRTSNRSLSARRRTSRHARKPKTPHDLTAHHLHRTSSADVRRLLVVAVREEGPRTQSATRRTLGVQHHRISRSIRRCQV